MPDGNYFETFIRRTFNMETKDYLIKMIRGGASQRNIAASCRVSRATVRHFLKRYGGEDEE